MPRNADIRNVIYIIRLSTTLPLKMLLIMNYITAF